MSKRKKIALIELIILVSTIIICNFIINNNSNQKYKHSSNASTVIIGSKNFTESKIVMQIWADALKKEGFNVRTKPNISSSVVYQAIRSKQVTLYPEYTGTIALSYLTET